MGSSWWLLLCPALQGSLVGLTCHDARQSTKPRPRPGGAMRAQTDLTFMEEGGWQGWPRGRGKSARPQTPPAAFTARSMVRFTQAAWPATPQPQHRSLAEQTEVEAVWGGDLGGSPNGGRACPGPPSPATPASRPAPRMLPNPSGFSPPLHESPPAPPRPQRM